MNLSRRESIKLVGTATVGMLAGVGRADDITSDKIPTRLPLDEFVKDPDLLAALVRGVLTEIDLKRTSVILTSDHGNIEDLSSRNHTLNPVPTIVWGVDRERIANRIRNLADITPAIVETLTTKAAAQK